MINETVNKHLSKEENKVESITEGSIQAQMWDVLNVVSTTNNGKLMLKNLNKEQQKLVTLMVKDGLVRMDSFINSRDSISWTDTGKAVHSFFKGKQLK